MARVLWAEAEKNQMAFANVLLDDDRVSFQKIGALDPAAKERVIGIEGGDRLCAGVYVE